MSQTRLYIPASRWSRLVVLEPSELHYLLHVLRLSQGGRVEIFDGQSRFAAGTLLFLQDQWAIEVISEKIQEQEGQRIHLGMALLKGRKLDLVVRMVCEIGVAAIQPFVCRRSITQPDPSSTKRKMLRWRQIAISAARQSGRVSVLEIKEILTFSDLLASAAFARKVILVEQTCGQSLASFVGQSPAGDLLMLVGPEGGFTQKEVDQAKACGFLEVSLGSSILQADTAAVVAASVAMAGFSKFGCLDSEPHGRVRVGTERKIK